LNGFYQPIESGNYAYRPVVFASYALDWLWHGANATGWHVSNFIIHIVNAALVMFLAYRLATHIGFADARFASAAASALFLAIPFAGESTFWPVGRFDLIACMFSLGFLLALVSFRGNFLVLMCLLAALLAKESAMPMVVIGFMLLWSVQLLERRSDGGTAPVSVASQFQ
jgi:protein O-mannosyl-transferase